jgi:SAM-dependent methyltransferase
MERAPDSFECWSRYWSEGHAHSCPTSFTGFYDRVLDLGCGNGALIHFLSGTSPAAAEADYHGVDASALRPPARNDAAASGRVHFHERTAYSALPLEDRSVSVAISQFGFEYGADDSAWAELFRVLRPRSRVAMVLHKRGSQLDRVAADEIALARGALDADGLFAAALDIATYLPQTRTDAGRSALRQDAGAEAARRRYNSAADVLTNLSKLLKHGGAATELLQGVAECLGVATAVPPAQVRTTLERLRDNTRNHLARIQALHDAALDRAGIDRFHDRFQAAGFGQPRIGVIHEEGYEMGWTLEALRESAG